MTATIRFGTPPPDAAEQVVVQTRWGDPATPQPGAWRDTFVYGIGVTASALNATWRNLAGGANESFQLNSDTRRRAALTHPDSGIRANGFNVVVYWNGNASVDNWADVIEADGYPLTVVQGIVNDVDNEWLALTDGQAAAADIDTVLTTPIGLYDAHPSVIAYSLADDLSNTAEVGRRAGELMDRIPELDAAERPASPSFLGNNSRLAIDDATYDIGIFGGGGYPSRWTSTGVKRAEGDFTHSGATSDWWEWTREFVVAYPDAHIWWWLQAHQLGDGSVLSEHLTYPTPAEIRKQVWESVGAGVKGILWFVYQDEPAGPWVGLAHPDSAARMSAVAEMARRLTPNIRHRLLRATPVADLFAASGGGSAAWAYDTFANAFIATLQDSRSGNYYCVVCNRATTTQSVTISSATLAGTLRNLESGATLALNSSVSLPALDGTIYRFVQSGSVGVPMVRLTEADNDVLIEDFWTAHWANPASVSYVAPGTHATHANSITVSDGQDLQAIIDAAPDNTTFVLEPGTYERIRLFERNGIHVIAADPLDRPVLRGVELYGWTTDLYHFDWSVGGWVDSLVDPTATTQAAARAAFENPPHDFIFRDIDITGDPTELMTRLEETWGGTTIRVLRNRAFFVMGCADILLETSTIRGFRYSPNDVWPLPNTNNYDHHGVIQGTGGCENFVVRDCEIWGHEADAAFGFPVAFYVDGWLNGVLHNNSFPGKYHQGALLTLTNWDVQYDHDDNANENEFREIRDPKYLCIVGNDLPIYRYAWSTRNGRHILMAENTWTYPGLRESFTRIECDGGGVILRTEDIVIRDNDFSGGNVGDSSGSGMVNIPINSDYVDSITITGNAIISAHTYPNGILTEEDPGGWAASVAVISGNTP